ncbi:division/cell wall cluster transcriptional repressor MraZ [Patescibacteria group bacterium]|nr:division/cell wall cluster transcriptional repressor MraZ [Patescibacteria group bacterium]
MFIGEYAHTIDEKNRLAVPIKFRKELDKGAIVTKGLEGCLFLYTLTEWQKLADKITQMPISQKAPRAFSRFILGGAMDVEIDKQGRIILPKYLIDFAKIKRNVIVAGLSNRLEIWDARAWEVYKKATEKDSEALAEQLFI